MSVNYNILDKEKNILHQRRINACFSEFPYYRAADFTSIGYIHYLVAPSTQLTSEECTRYLSLLKTIGFPITQEPDTVVKDGLMLDLDECKHLDKIRAPIVGATLTLVRYLQEFTKIVSATLNIVDINPKINPWDALRLGHLCKTVGPSSGNLYFGSGHALFTFSYAGGLPRKTWKQVLTSLDTSTLWKPNFGLWSIQSTYGSQVAYSEANQKKISDTIIVDQDTLQEAMAWLK